MTGSMRTGRQVPRHPNARGDGGPTDDFETQRTDGVPPYRDEPDSRPEPPPARRPSSRLGRVAEALERTATRVSGRDALPDDRRAESPARWWFALAAAFYVVYQLLTRGRTILGGQMWAEMGTNYFATTTEGNVLSKLFATDAGYVPLPQRIIATIGQQIGVAPTAIPYFYTGTAVLLSGLLIASICLPAFRPVIESDALRFVLAVALVILPDFETRTFINFTYFSLVFASFLTALAFVRRDGQVPAWAWLLPLFMLSKPAVLALLPAVLVTAVISGGRFRRVALASAVAGVVQVAQLAVSAASGDSLLQSSNAGPLAKLGATLGYTFGFLGRMSVDPGLTFGRAVWFVAAIGLLGLSLAVLWSARSRSAPLIVIGLSLVLFTMLVDCFTFSDAFDTEFTMLAYPGFDRRFYGAVTGVLFVVAGLVATLVQAPAPRRVLSRTLDRLPGRTGALDVRGVASGLGVALFGVWFVLSGWLHYTAAINQPIRFPMAGVSQWTEMAPVLESAEPVVCVPLDPFGWVYGRNCGLMVEQPGLPAGYGWSPVGESGELTVRAPSEVGRGGLASVGLMVLPPSGRSEVTGTAVLTAADGTVTTLRAEAELPPEGGLVQFSQSPVLPAHEVESVTFAFDLPVSVGSADPSNPRDAVLLWMGQPAP
jgi:hypothetical protein